MTHAPRLIYAQTASAPQPSLARPAARLSLVRAPDAPATPDRAAPPTDHELLAILDEPRQPGETAEAHFRRKETALGTAFAALRAIEAMALHKRLSSPGPDDALASRFARMTIDRRHRLLAFLRDARRREAIAAARR